MSTQQKFEQQRRKLVRDRLEELVQAGLLEIVRRDMEGRALYRLTEPQVELAKVE